MDDYIDEQKDGRMDGWIMSFKWLSRVSEWVVKWVGEWIDG